MWSDRGGGFDGSPPGSSAAERLQGVFDECERRYRDAALPLLELAGDDLPSPTSTGDGHARNSVTVSLGLSYGNSLDPTTPRVEVHVSIPGQEPVETMMLDLPPLGPTPDVDTDTDSLRIIIDGEQMSPVYPRRHNTDWVLCVPYRGNIVTVAGHRWESAGGTLELRPVTDISPYLANFIDAIKAITTCGDIQDGGQPLRTGSGRRCSKSRAHESTAHGGRRLYGAYQSGNQGTRNRTRWDATGREPNGHKSFCDSGG